MRSLSKSVPSSSAAAARDVLVGGPVEPVLADVELVVLLVGQAVHEHVRRHALVEGRVEDRHLRQPREDGLAGGDAGQVGRVVQGRDGDALLDGRAHARGDQRRVRELLAAVDHAVPDGVDLDLVLEQAVLRVEQRVLHGGHGLGVVLGHDLQHQLVRRLVRLVGELRLLAPDLLDQALGQQGRLAAVKS